MISCLRLTGVSQTVAEAGGEKRTLAPLTASLPAGMLHVIGGPAGSGKTSLLAILSLTAAAAQGDIYWGTRKLSTLGPIEAQEWRKRNIATIGPASTLVPLLTIRENIKLAAAVRGRADAARRGEAMIAALDLGSGLNRLPAELAESDIRQIAVVLALCREPAIVLADEPTAALGGTAATAIARLLRAYAHDRHAVVVCVSEDLPMLAMADNVLRLQPP